MEYEAARAPEPVWKDCRREKYLACAVSPPQTFPFVDESAFRQASQARPSMLKTHTIRTNKKSQDQDCQDLCTMQDTFRLESTGLNRIAFGRFWSTMDSIGASILRLESVRKFYEESSKVIVSKDCWPPLVGHVTWAEQGYRRLEMTLVDNM